MIGSFNGYRYGLKVPVSKNEKPEQLFVFADESGNLDFTQNGTNNFVMASVMTTNPVSSAKPLQRLKYALISQDLDVSSFRASKDLRRIRSQVIESFAELNLEKVHILFG